MRIALWGLVFCLSCPASAYLQYSLRYNQLSCTNCHFSPVGGGPRHLTGKLFGQHNYRAHPKLAQEWLSADLRLLYYRPENAKQSKSGMGVMSGSLAGHAWLDEKRQLLAVLEHNVAGFAAAPFRDTYILWRPAAGQFLESILAGRFRAPFGLVNDEHRTYTRIQTSTEYYSFETGVLLSGRPAESLHYDLALVNGAHSSGSALANDRAGQWGSVFNLRWLRTPAMMGISLSHFEPSAERLTRKAWSLYAGGVWGNWSLLVEHTRARGFNSNLGQGFATSPAYVSAVAATESRGWLAWLEWASSERFTLMYKYDLLTPDVGFPADIFERHGLGFRWFVGPNAQVLTRFEQARATPPSEKAGAARGNQDAAFVILQVSL